MPVDIDAVDYFLAALKYRQACSLSFRYSYKGDYSPSE